MMPLYKEEWGEHGKEYKEVWGCLGTPIWNTYQEMHMCPLTLTTTKGGDYMYISW